MELLSFTNGVIQVGVILAASLHVTDTRGRRLVLVLSGASLAFSIAGLLLLLSPALPDVAGKLASWALYAAIGLAVLLGLLAGGRGMGRMRVAWPQGRYVQYRKYQGYRRIV
ncbi:MAG: hypothetical protein KAX65_08420 [Caldilineaceae bacterium]|nr:hypothetical protein [Caldilineaceae bacterium]